MFVLRKTILKRNYISSAMEKERRKRERGKCVKNQIEILRKEFLILNLSNQNYKTTEETFAEWVQKHMQGRDNIRGSFSLSLHLSIYLTRLLQTIFKFFQE